MNRKTSGCHRFPLFSTASFFTAKSIYAVLAASLLPYQSPTHGLLARSSAYPRAERGAVARRVSRASRVPKGSGARSRDECPAHHVYRKVFAELNSSVQEGLLPTYAETLMNPNATNHMAVGARRCAAPWPTSAAEGVCKIWPWLWPIAGYGRMAQSSA